MAQHLDNFRIMNIDGIDYYGGYDNKMNFHKGGLAIWVDKCIHVFDSDRYISELRYRVNATSKHEKTCVFDDETFATKGYTYYKKKGVGVTYSTQQIFEDYIESQRSMIDHIDYAHDWMGWDNNLNYKTPKQKEKRLYKHFTVKLGPRMTSKYQGAYNIKPMGTWEVWLEGVTEHVLGYLPLEAAIVMGLSAVVVGYFGSKKLPPNLLFHLVGRSSIGKSTAAMLAVSTAGCPNVNAPKEFGRPLMGSWGATENASLAKLRGNHGVVQCFDEIGTYSENKFEQMLYKLYTGTDKVRLDQNAQLPDEAEANWCTALISTGEEPLESLMKKTPDGARMRCFQFTDLRITDDQGEVQTARWTQSAENARAIQAFTSENYGFAAPRLAEIILKIGDEKMSRMYENARKVYLQRKGKSGTLHERRADFMGMVLLTAYLIEKKMEIPINYKKICDFFILNEESFQTEHMHAYKYLCELATTHRTMHFWDNDDKKNNASVKELWGTVESKHLRMKSREYEGKTVVREIAFLSTVFEKLLEKQNYTSGRVIDGLKEEGILSVEGDGHNTRTRVDPLHPGTYQEYYVIRIFKEE